MAETKENSRMYTVHGRKKNQGQWAKVNNCPALTFTVNENGKDKVVGYTTIDEMMKMAYSSDLPEYKLDF